MTHSGASAEAARYLGEDRLLFNKAIGEWDAAALLKLMWDTWNDVFRRTLGPAERSLVSELRDLATHPGRSCRQGSLHSGQARYARLTSVP